MGIISTRRHRIMAARGRQLRLNALAAHGGRPYVEARLWRAPNETDASWRGDPESGVAGRMERTACVDDAMRVANKINQYIFRRPAARNGGDAAFLADCTGDGEGVDAFMRRVSIAVTHGGWCWVQADRAPIPPGEAETLATKRPVRLILWEAQDVQDWRLDADGGIRWLVVKSRVYDNRDPRRDPTDGWMCTLYELDGGRVYVTEEMAEGRAPPEGLRTRQELPGLRRIPFVLVGRPSERAWWFDGVENLQAQMLNLDSMHNETLTETVYPQLVVPTSLADSLEVRLAEKNIDGRKVASLVRELTVGRKIPILESGEDKGITRYINPSGDLKLLTDEAMRKRTLLFDTAGLAMFNRETRQVQTAEAKAFDQLDTNATLGARALLLQEAEARIVEAVAAFDPSFRAWEPKYETAFDVVDVAALAQALAVAANMPDKTPEVKRICALVNVRILRELAAGTVPEEDFDAALDEIAAHDFAARTLLPDPFAAPDGGDGGGAGDGDAK